jgi:hypothetical protein
MRISGSMMVLFCDGQARDQESAEKDISTIVAVKSSSEHLLSLLARQRVERATSSRTVSVSLPCPKEWQETRHDQHDARLSLSR